MTRGAAVAVLGLILAVASADGASASPELLARVQLAATRYHEDPGMLDAVQQALERAVAGQDRADLLIALARIAFIRGDVRAGSDAEKLALYERGREAARRAVELEPNNALAHLWAAVNTARWGQTKGVVRSLFLLPEVQRGIDTVLALDPTLTPVYSLAGYVALEVPGLLGGDLARAEAMFRKGLEHDPHFTGLRVGLAKTLVKRGRTDEGRREIQAVLDERTPTNPADWAMKDAPEARRLLASLRGRS